MLICRCICCSILYNCINIFYNVINIFCIYFVLTKCSDWFNFCHMIIKAHVIFQTPQQTSRRRAFARNIEVYPCIFQVFASLPNRGETWGGYWGGGGGGGGGGLEKKFQPPHLPAFWGKIVARNENLLHGIIGFGRAILADTPQIKRG
jgi:hypothetical protein